MRYGLCFFSGYGSAMLLCHTYNNFCITSQNRYSSKRAHFTQCNTMNALRRDCRKVCTLIHICLIRNIATTKTCERHWTLEERSGKQWGAVRRRQWPMAIWNSCKHVCLTRAYWTSQRSFHWRILSLGTHSLMRLPNQAMIHWALAMCVPTLRDTTTLNLSISSAKGRGAHTVVQY